MTQRIEDGEVLSYDVIKGVVEHVDGQGQCFIDARNILNGVTECAKVSRNVLINDVIGNRQQYFGWEKGSTMLKTEYDFDVSTCSRRSDFVSKYVEGEFQSGILELLYAAKTDRRHFIVVSAVRDESWSAITAVIPCYDKCSVDTKLSILQAGVITTEQLKSSIILFSNGALVNPHVSLVA